MRINLLDEPYCKICNTYHSCMASLSKHLKKTHNILSPEYTKVYLLHNNIPICECGCGQPVIVREYHYRTYRCNNRKYFYNDLYDKDSKEYKSIIDKISKASTNMHLKNAMYSRNPEDWKLKCPNCGEYCIYTNYDSYKNAVRYNKENPDNKRKCKKCININRVVSEESRKKMSESAKNKIITLESAARRSEKLSNSHKERYRNMTNEDRDKLTQSIIEGQRKKPEHEQVEWQNRKRQSMRRRMKELGAEHTFKPLYNKNTIPYIVDILNVRYNTEFIHGKSDSGEFKVYDSVEGRFFYADAYCPKLNIWVEFDEPYHNAKKYKEYDLYKEERIRSILNCKILRIPFNIKKLK